MTESSLTSSICPANDEAMLEAVRRLAAGELVTFPTETVYGLGADATSDRAVARIFEAKGRPQFNPLIVHVADVAAARRIAAFSPLAEELATAFWPGPFTLVLPRAQDCPVSRLASAGLDTVAVRVPAHPLARQLLRSFGRPVAAPSANPSGTISPTTPAHVLQGLGEKAGFILADGKCSVGLESTVLDVSTAPPVLLRPGAVTRDEIERVAGEISVVHETAQSEEDRPRSPGLLLRHYAPKTPLRLNAVDLNPGEALLAFGSIRFMGIKGGGAAAALPEEMCQNLSVSGDLVEAAANLFEMLHRLDAAGAEAIAVMSVPDIGLGVAINDRLRRAAAGGEAPEK